jgi:hypothetical protein
MYQYTNTILNQLLNFLPKHKFKEFIGQHKADKHVRRLNTWNQLVALLYAQATYKDSLREIETGLLLHQGTWHHLGVGSVAKSTLSDANTRRSYKIFEKLFYELLGRCKNITPQRKFTFKNALYSLDATIVNLCLSSFKWAKYSKLKGALKVHTLLNNRTAIPELITITNGNVADITAAKKLSFSLEKGSIIVYDRAYIDYSWWNRLDKGGLFFVSRVKSSLRIDIIGQHKSKENKVDNSILADDIVMCGEYQGMKKYEGKTMRRVRILDKEKSQIYEYLTNNFELPAEDIALIYKERWQIELFFKWIKQNLKIKTFLGVSKNAVLTQIWVAMIYYLLLSYIKFQTKFNKSLLELTRMVREVLLNRINLIDLLSLNTRTLYKINAREGPQLALL